MNGLMVRTLMFKGLFAGLAAIIFFAVLLTAAPFHAAFAATAPPLGTAQTYGVVAGDTVTNTGPSVVTGDLGVSPGSAYGDFTGPPNGTVTGAIHAGDAVSLQAKSDSRTAYNNLTGQACTFTYLVPTDLAGANFGPGVYCFASSAGLTGTLTLTGAATDVWVFKTVSTLITGPGSSVVMSGGGQDCNVYWQVGSSATLDTTTQFIGTILAHTSISLLTGANLSGRALAGLQAGGGGAVTMDTNLITPAACSAAVPPTLLKTFFPTTINAGGNSLLTITLSNPNSTAAGSASLTDTLPIGVTFVGSASNNGCGGSLTNDTTTVTLTGGSIPLNDSCTVTATVTSSVPGLHLNTTGALVTDKGTAPPASDTLIVNQISIVKSFTPATIVAGGVSLLTITVSNPNNIAIPVAFTDFLPSSPGQMLVATGPGPLTNTCSGTLTATTGSSSVIYEGGLLPAGPSSCTVTVYVTATALGNYTNLLATASAILHVLAVIPPSSAGEHPYIAIVGNDIDMNPFYLSPKHLQFAFDQTLFDVPLCDGTFPVVNQYTRVGGEGCESFFSQTPIIQPEICDLNGTGKTPPFLFRGLFNAKTPAGNAGFYEWWIRLPKKPDGEINIVIQCGVVKPNAFAVYDFDSVALCAAETGERIGAGTCVRQEVDPGVSPVVNTALPKITAIAYPGPYNDFTPFNLTAFKNPSAYTLSFAATDPFVMSNNGNAQVLDGSSNTRILLKTCMDKAIVTKLPVTGQGNALGQIETDLEAGDLIKVRMDVPRQNTVDIYCHAQSARLMGVGEAPF